MTRAHAAIVLALVVCLTASPAAAQQVTPALAALPTGSARFDAAGHVTWLGERRAVDDLFRSDRWFGVASGGGSVGYYWTAHLKTEFDVSTSNEGESYSYQTVAIPGQTTPLFVERDREVRFTTVSAGLTGQFFENVWFHPFVSAGIELVREREHIETIPPPVPPRGPSGIVTPQADTRVRYLGRPYTGAGFKVYVSDHAFIRADIRTSWSSDGLAAIGWRSGVGVDF